MDRPKDSQTPASARSAKQASSSSSSGRTIYLILYNAISASLWATLLVEVSTKLPQQNYQQIFASVGPRVQWIQTLAILEVLHSLIGLVRAPLVTTAMQVASRLLLVWGISYPFPQVVADSPAFSTMLLAWSTTEVVRYSYFAVQLALGSVPAVLLWLRYNTFFVLYPMGIASECWLVWQSTGPAKVYGDVWVWALRAVLAIYVPGSYILFTHMVTQRRKIMRASRETRKST